MNPQQERVKELVHVFRGMDPNFHSNDAKLVQTLSLKQSFDQYKEMQEAIVKEFNSVNKSIQKRISPQVKE
jgi:hypothetical protein